MTTQLQHADIFKTKDLPTLPVVASRVLALSAQNEVDLQEISRVISQDMSLAGKLLRVVNSPFYGFAGTIGTVSKAVSVMGINAVRSLTLSFSLLDMRDRGMADDFDFEKFWERSLATAVSARLIMRQLNDPGPEEGFIAGLLENIGEMVLARAVPEIYREIRRDLQDNGAALAAGERTRLGLDHTEVGSELARRWGLPAQIALPIAHHHQPESYTGSDQRIALLVRVAHLAGLLADTFYAVDPQKNQEAFVQRAGQLLELSPKACRQIAEQVHKEVNQAADYFGLNVRLELSITEILQEANQRLSQINLTYEQMNRELIHTKMELFQLNKSLQKKSEQLERLAHFDGLTEVYNYRFLQTFLNGEMVRAARLGQDISLVLADIDNFKALNDRFGHQTGDAVLRELCRVARVCLREYDLIARYGGEEFAFVLPQTNLQEAVAVAERLRSRVAEYAFQHEGRICRITLSLGVACLSPANAHVVPEDLIRLADQALLDAKGTGKDRIIVAENTSL